MHNESMKFFCGGAIFSTMFLKTAMVKLTHSLGSPLPIYTFTQKEKSAK